MAEVKDLPPANDARFLEAVRQALRVLMGTLGDGSMSAVRWNSLVKGGLASSPGSVGGGGGSGGGSGGSSDLDPTPPPQVSNFHADAGLTFIGPRWDLAVYTAGHGPGQVNIYGVQRLLTDTSLPTFGDAVLVGTALYPMTFLAIGSEPDRRWHLWAKHKSVDGIESSTPAGGLHGVVVQTGDDPSALTSSLARFGQAFITYGMVATLDAMTLTAGDGSIGGRLKSTNYNGTGLGWIIRPDGFLEANNALIRGTVFAGAGAIGGISIYSNTVESSNYNGTSAGFRLDGALGKIFAYGGEFGGELKGATGTFSGALVAASGSFSGTLNAVTGSFGNVTIAAGGSIRQGMASFMSGAGIWLGDDGGTFKFCIGNSDGANMGWDGSDLFLNGVKFDTFTASIPDGDATATQYAAGSFGVANRSVSVTGGRAPYAYTWILQPLSAEFPLGSIYISGGQRTNTVNIAAEGTGTDYTSRIAVMANLVCIVRDANGRTTTADVNLTVNFAREFTGGS